ncbi:nitroreductase [Ancylobacter novellus DSM 506]|uniref:Putative NAD(P)H nitroreductase n=1 Tax=Ancylobacter novellus (strain ATCC 8093 / DSM 506 / JCM 20403 / CCM 1077 / IAM 12100 / NBRC 12443 / NCIMB 10456) TaxID=639283 RepID=D7AAH2_ANCN5|nr:nitroreductase [Ancylobacter novellus]ADH88975.1 nitroreductase [Ancylobacter novellus DSM 506]
MNHHAHNHPPPPDLDDAAPLDIAPADEMLARLETRRSAPLRGLVEPGPTPQELERMLRLAARVPDHGRLVPWRFVVIQGEARRTLGEKLDALYARQNPGLPAAKADMWTLYMLRAPVTVVLVSRPDPAAKVPEWNQVLSAGAAGMGLTVAASALGFATQWLLKWPGRDAEATALLGLSRSEKVAGFIHIGRPVRHAEDRPRPALDEVVTYWSPDQSMSKDTP